MHGLTHWTEIYNIEKFWYMQPVVLITLQNTTYWVINMFGGAEVYYYCNKEEVFKHVSNIYACLTAVEKHLLLKELENYISVEEPNSL